MIARWPCLLIPLLLATMLATVSAGFTAAEDKANPDLPGDDTVTPAIDPAKLVDSIFLQFQDSRNRTQSSNNLKQIGLAVYNYSVKNDNKLPCDVLDGSGKPMLSWRVLLLPYLDQQAL